MYWCYNCSEENSCPRECPSCHSEAVQQVCSHSNPKAFKPYTIHEEEGQTFQSFQSLYRSIYRDLFSTVSQRRPQAIRRINSNGNYQVSYVIVIDSQADDQIKGLNQSQIDNLQRKIINSECTICQESRICQGISLQCGHEFHEECLIPWVKTNGTCPSCRHNLMQQ